MNTGAFIDPETLISDIVMFCNDEEMRFLSKRSYLWQIQQALQELSFDTFFDKRHEDFDYSSKIAMPKGSFNIKGVYLFSGECDITKSQKVWWKRNFIRTGNGYTANNKDRARDPFFKGTRTNENHYFYDVQNGLINFSTHCDGKFEKVRIVYNGIGGDILDTPIIPAFARQAIVDWVTVRVCRMRIPEDRQLYTALYQVAKLSLEGSRPPFTGTWYNAEYRLKNLDKDMREALYEYNLKMND